MDNYLQLGDIIKIVSVKDSRFNDGTFYISYFDPKELMEIVNVASLASHQISLKNGKITDAIIDKIVLLNRSHYRGFARQNGLLQGTWIEMEFYSDVRHVITGIITHVENDMIEITTYPEEEILYIDFAFKGIPKGIPLKSICFCKKPASYKSIQPEEESDEDLEEEEDFSTEYNEEGELVLQIPSKLRLEEDYRNELNKEYLEGIETIEEEEPYQYETNMVESQIRYNVDVQMNELLDDLLYRIPEEKRSKRILNEIQTHVNRFRELRDIYSIKDEYDQVRSFIIHDPKGYKPLADSLYTLDTSIPWICPVASVVRDVYTDGDIDNRDVVAYDEHEEMQQHLDEKQIQKELFWENNTEDVNKIKYADMYHTLNHSYYKPFDQVADENIIFNPLAKNIAIQKDLDMLVSHDDDLAGTYVECIPISKTKYDVIVNRKKRKTMRFEETIHYSHYLSKNQSERRVLMHNEHVNLHSLVLLPNKYVNESRNNKLFSNVLQRSKYHAPYLFDILNGEMTRKMVDVDTMNDVFPLESSTTHLLLSPTERPLYSEEIAHPLYNSFLRNFVPNTFSIMEHLYPENERSYNLSQYIDVLSSYNIYKDGLTYMAGQKIKKHIFQNILNYNKDLLEKKDAYGNYAVEKFQKETVDFSDTVYDSMMNKMFVGNSTIQKEIRKNYDLMGKKINDSEALNNVLLYDNGHLFSLWLLMMNQVLISPLSMTEPYVEPQHFYDSEQKAIAKKYDSLRKMQDDNDNRDLKYDEKYDANNYDILLKYRKERSRMTEPQYIDFLKTKMAEDYGCSLENTEKLAQEILQGYKLVREGDYALLEIRPQMPPGVEECSFTEKEKDEIRIESNVRKVEKYFKRIQHVWVYDSDVNADSFAKPKNMTCDLTGDSNVVGKMFNNQKLFANEYGDTMDKIERKIREKTLLCKARLQLTKELEWVYKEQFEKYHQMLGHRAYISESIPPESQKLLDFINHKCIDFEEKQANIISFYSYYCREPLPDENKYWKYSKESKHSVKLLPGSQYRLAVAYQENNYNEVLRDLLREVGTVDEGYYIDSYCGNRLCEQEFSEQGTELFMELEEQNTFEEEVETGYDVDDHSNKKLYKNSDLRKIYNIMTSICKNLYIDHDKIEDVVMGLMIDFISDKGLFMGETKYEAKMAKKRKENPKKKFPSYENYKMKTILNIVVCCIVVAIQTIIPSIKPRRTFGDCVKILDGYPLSEESGNMGTIDYLACILRKMQEDKKTLPWSEIPKGKGKMEDRLTEVFKMIIDNERIQSLLRTKREYLKTYVPIDKAITMSIKWVNFLPPLKPTDVVSGKVPLRNVNPSIHKELKSTLTQGHQDQWKLLGMYFCKVLSFSFGTQEIINTVVKDKEILLGKYGNVPLIENACCNEIDMPINPIEYFIKEDERIKQHLEVINGLSGVIQKTKNMLKAPFVHYEQKNEIEKRLIRNEFCYYSEELMYKTLISYCNLDSETKPIPEFLHNFISEKIDTYDAKSSIEEKILLLKEHGKSLNMGKFNSIMKQVYLHNEVYLHKGLQMSYHDQVMESLLHWKECSENQKVNGFYELFETYVERDQIDVTEETTPEILKKKLLDDLEDYLKKQIDYMKNEIREFMMDLNERENSINSILSKFEGWDEDLSYENFGMFVKNYLYYVCAIVPNYISKGTCAVKNPSNWKLMKHDYDKLWKKVDEKYNPLNNLVGDLYLVPFMNEIKNCLKKMHTFLVEFYGFFPSDRKSLYGRYFLFTIHFVFHYLISLSRNDDIHTSIIQRVNREEEEYEEHLLDEDAEEVQIETVDKIKVQEKVLKLIRILLQSDSVFQKDKQVVLLTYKDIRKNIDRVEEEEKKKMMGIFEDIKDIKERRTELLLKKFHLGKFFIDPKVIKKYGKRRDKMLDTEDETEADFLFGDTDGDDLVEQLANMDIEDHNVFTSLEEIDELEDEDADEEIGFLENHDEEDVYDIAENAYNNL